MSSYLGSKLNFQHLTRETYNKTKIRSQAVLDKEDSIDYSIVAVVVNPSLMEWGNPQGKNYGHHDAIVPALV